VRRDNRIVELAAWGFDENPDRDRFVRADDLVDVQERAANLIQSRPKWDSISPVVDDATDQLKHRLSRYSTRNDLQMEFAGLEWKLAVVDLRRLLSFQRRLVLPEKELQPQSIEESDWQKRLELAFPSSRTSQFTRRSNATELTLKTENPDFSVSLKPSSKDAESFEVALCHGSPFMEVARYRDRWFLRDGYHRAYRLLRSHVFAVPAAIVEARSLKELGAVEPWFFTEEVLSGDHPPLVTDFTSEDLVLRWRRPARRKVIRVVITEHFETLNFEEEKGADHEHSNPAR
jgi:hypothetical protein